MSLKIITDEKLSIDVDGVSYSVKIPSMKQIAELEKKSKTVEPSDLPGYYEDFFSDLGLPKEVSEKFNFKHWKSLIEELLGTKKA
jgi:hypothetical protein